MLMLDLALTRTQIDAPQPEQANAAATRRPALGSHESRSNSGQQRPSDTARARPLELATSSSPSGTVSPSSSPAVVLKDKSGETSSRAVSPNQTFLGEIEFSATDPTEARTAKFFHFARRAGYKPGKRE